MKRTLLKIIKKYKIPALIQIFFIILNSYFLTFPPKIIGNIVDLLYNIPENKNLIFKQVFYLIMSTLLLLAARMPWRWLSGYTPRNIEKDLKNKLFEQFMKIKLANIQNIKNGELMSYFVKDITEIRKFSYRLLSYGSRIVFICITSMTFFENWL